MAITRQVWDRFEAKALADDIGDCIIWVGARSKGGYGQLRVDYRLEYAHRLAYEQFVGPVPEGTEIDHLCRVRSCVNPEHLEPVTRRENLRRGLKGVLLTRCVNGHPRTEQNTYVRPDGRGRQCKVCARERA